MKKQASTFTPKQSWDIKHDKRTRGGASSINLFEAYAMRRFVKKTTNETSGKESVDGRSDVHLLSRCFRMKDR